MHRSTRLNQRVAAAAACGTATAHHDAARQPTTGHPTANLDTTSDAVRSRPRAQRQASGPASRLHCVSAGNSHVARQLARSAGRQHHCPACSSTTIQQKRGTGLSSSATSTYRHRAGRHRRVTARKLQCTALNSSHPRPYGHVSRRTLLCITAANTHNPATAPRAGRHMHAATDAKLRRARGNRNMPAASTQTAARGQGGNTGHAVTLAAAHYHRSRANRGRASYQRGSTRHAAVRRPGAHENAA